MSSVELVWPKAFMQLPYPGVAFDCAWKKMVHHGLMPVGVILREMAAIAIPKEEDTSARYSHKSHTKKQRKTANQTANQTDERLWATPSFPGQPLPLDPQPHTHRPRGKQFPRNHANGLFSCSPMSRNHSLHAGKVVTT